MDIDRPHRSNSSCSSSTTTTSELFICFTSRLSSSSSMKISSKSILSPGRSRESSQISLSTSLSRRLRTNGSMRGGQASPMFPTHTKKRGSFDNPEPSSPKVTCIGQVRVKTKKQGKKIRSRSARSGGGEVSFRRVEHAKSCNLEDLETQFLNQNQEQQHQQMVQEECLAHRNQKWVHLPVSICEALRGFGAEFNCFLPCRSSCTAAEKDKEEKAAGSNASSSSCGAVFGRWLVAVQDGSDGKGREIELVVDEHEEIEEDHEERRRSYRRHVFEEIDFKEEKYHQHVQEKDEVGEDETTRVSVCVPPKNALLLMRCRSDPVKMAALANKFWEPPPPPPPNDEDEEDDKEDEEQQLKSTDVGEHERRIEEEEIEECTSKEKSGSSDIIQETITDIVQHEWDLVKEQQEKQIQETPSSPQEENKDQESEGNLTDSSVNSVHPVSQDYRVTEHELELQEVQESESETEEEEEQSAIQESKEHKQEETEKNCSQVEDQENQEEETLTHERSEQEETLKTQQEGQTGIQSKERENQNQPLLPDCLLLMMCEPKLSMEVSKETWVCSTDFIRWLPEPSRPVKKKPNGGADHEPKKRTSIDIKFNPPLVHSKLQQPPRSSCSYPAKPPARAPGAESVSSAIEQKLVGSKACEPFMLKRCKSEPVRSTAKLAPENCFWKNRKLEPHCPATLGVGAAGVGC